MICKTILTPEPGYDCNTSDLLVLAIGLRCHWCVLIFGLHLRGGGGGGGGGGSDSDLFTNWPWSSCSVKRATTTRLLTLTNVTIPNFYFPMIE